MTTNESNESKSKPHTWDDIPTKTFVQHDSSVDKATYGERYSFKISLLDSEFNLTEHTIVVDIRGEVVPQRLTDLLPRKLSVQKSQELKDIQAIHQIIAGLRAIFPDESSLIHLAPESPPHAIDQVFRFISGHLADRRWYTRPLNKFPRDREHVKVFQRPVLETLLSAYRFKGFIHGDQSLCDLLFRVGFSRTSYYHALCCRPRLPTEILLGRDMEKEKSMVKFIREHWILSQSLWIVDGAGHLDLPPTEADVLAVMSLPKLVDKISGEGPPDNLVYRTARWGR